MTLPDGIEYREIDGKKHLATRGVTVSDEPTDGEWRALRPGRSKLAAMLEQGLLVDVSLTQSILYLGAATGTTVSHLADITGPVYAVEIAARPMRDLLAIAETRQPIIPLLKDARRPETYAHVVEANVGIVFQDIATRGQAEVALANRQFLADEGHYLLSIKARSEDVTAPPEAVFDEALNELRQEYTIVDSANLDPYHTDHLGVVATPRG